VGRGCRRERSRPDDQIVLAFGVLLNNVVTLDVDQPDEPWTKGVPARSQAGLFEPITADTYQ
jgi:hypothetical protein